MRIQLDERDYVNAAWAAAMPTRRIVVVLAAASFSVVLGAYLGWRAGYMRESIVAICVWFFGLAGAVIGHLVTIPPKAKRVFRQQQALQRPYELTWNDGAVSVVGSTGTSTTPWTDFHKARELNDQFLLFLSDAAFLMVPKRAFPDEAVMCDFRALLKRNVPGL